MNPEDLTPIKKFFFQTKLYSLGHKIYATTKVYPYGEYDAAYIVINSVLGEQPISMAANILESLVNIRK